MADIKYLKDINTNLKSGSQFKRDLYASLKEKKEDLMRCKQCYDDMIEVKDELININIDNKIYKKVINEMEMISKEQNIITKKKYEDDIRKSTLNIEIEIEKRIRQNELKILEFEKKRDILDEEIINLKMKIEKLKEQNDNEIDLQKKKKLNKIKNYYKFKLVKYETEKSKQFEKAKALNEIQKKNFEVQKELEINDMKNISLLIQELIAIFKTNIINS